MIKCIWIFEHLWKSKNSLLIMVPNSKRQKCRKKTSELDIDWDDHFRVSLKTEIISFSNHLFSHNNDIMNLIRKNVTLTIFSVTGSEKTNFRFCIRILVIDGYQSWATNPISYCLRLVFIMNFVYTRILDCSILIGCGLSSLWKPKKYTETEKFYWADTK